MLSAVHLPFRDVDLTTPHLDDIRWLADAGISTGWPLGDGTSVFRGMGTVVRQDMAAFLRREAARFGIANAKGYKPGATDWKRFKDVDRSTPHAEDILWLASTGITTGYADGTFRGMTPVYRQDMAAFIHRLDDHINCEAKVTRVVVQEAWDEQVVDTPAWDEVIPAVTKVVHHDAVTHEEPVYETKKTLVQRYPDGFIIAADEFSKLSGIEQFKLEMAHGGHCTFIPGYAQVQTGTRIVVDTPAWDETVVITPEQTVHHEATYKTVHHDAVIENRTEFSNCRI
ncbi:internalin [Bifidobacterium italicum]|uniref:Internalin n=1 Tax=Bifidobacterium italicum TaxID=1960968 RepID=A0A2A2EJ58_9BIFI|nr:S-layer homology domain-containing protein [Bifidobacterium italicum]PAU69219.1 internalin [Bifidobacterium italicum]